MTLRWMTKVPMNGWKTSYSMLGFDSFEAQGILTSRDVVKQTM